ncbi:hypothetical protein FACS189432_06620 [Bacteroidia bacterium]|nr:hypothetical protein FACS189426_12870 [Bacteroidia bacterium]GHT28534.1 hypothetical protein FACS189432_06620 [Bacteroidia bacterium]
MKIIIAVAYIAIILITFSLLIYWLLNGITILYYKKKIREYSQSDADEISSFMLYIIGKGNFAIGECPTCKTILPSTLKVWVFLAYLISILFFTVALVWLLKETVEAKNTLIKSLIALLGIIILAAYILAFRAANKFIRNNPNNLKFMKRLWKCPVCNKLK